MIIKIHKLIVQTYGELIKENTKKLAKDILLLCAVIYLMFPIEKYTQGISFTLFDVAYRLDMVLFYLMGFVFIITTSVIFLDLKKFMDLATQFVITRFPKMNREFGPGKRIIMDLVQITVAFLVLKPVSLLLADVTIKGFDTVYFVSLSFLILALIFSYDILSNIKLILKGQLAAMSGRLLKQRAEIEDGE